MLTVAQQFARSLRETGVRYVFGVPSGSMIPYMEALRNEPDIEFILTGHESAAAFMAGICGRLTGTPGACFGTFGPGATNLSTGVGSAFLDRFPLLAFTDEMPDRLLRRTVQMNIDHQALFRPITKWTTRMDVSRVHETILKAAGIAVAGYPGPVHIGMPSGAGSQKVEEQTKDADYLQPKPNDVYPCEEAVENALQLLRKSEKPLLAVGLSALRAGIGDHILQLAEKFSLPVVLTPMAKGLFPEEHPSYAGVLFHALSGMVVDICRQADLVMGIGYDPVELNYEDWMPRVPLVHIDNRPADVDEEIISRVVNVPGHMAHALECLLNAGVQPSAWNLDKVKDHKTKMFEQLEPPRAGFDPRSVVAGLREALPQEGILTLDVGAHLHLAGQQWQTPSPDKLLMSNGWSSMGFGIPAAIAAKLCHSGLPVACLTGDGGLRMMAGEMATARRMNLHVVFVVVADSSLSLIRIKQDKQNVDNRYGTALAGLPQTPPGHLFGVPVVRVSHQAEYRMALGEAFATPGPVIIEAVVDGRGYDGLVLC